MPQERCCHCEKSHGKGQFALQQHLRSQDRNDSLLGLSFRRLNRRNHADIQQREDRVQQHPEGKTGLRPTAIPA